MSTKLILGPTIGIVIIKRITD